MFLAILNRLVRVWRHSLQNVPILEKPKIFGKNPIMT
jgi:hypothetical protein